MKILAVKNGGYILSTNYKNIGNYECQSIVKLLQNCGHSVTIATEQNYKEIDVNSYDKLICFNSSPFNFYGGNVIARNTYAYELMAKYNKTIFYVLLDMNLPFVQLWDKLYKFDCELRKSDVWVSNDIVIISQGYNVSEVLKKHNNNVCIRAVEYVPLNEWIYSIEKQRINIATVDLILGANYADAYRKKKYIDYLFDKDFTSEIYGKLDEKFFGKEKNTLFSKENIPVFSEQLSDCRDVVAKNATGLSTIICGNKLWSDNMPTLRIGEAFLADCVTFIDREFDSKQIIHPIDFCYVSNGKELQEKIKLIKKDDSIRQSILNAQRKVIENKKKAPMINKMIGVLEKYE